MKPKRRVIVLSVGIALTLIGIVLLFWPGTPKLYRTTILPVRSSYELAPCALNDLGQVVGLKLATGTPPRLFVWDRTGGVNDLGRVAGGDCDINNRGQIAAARVDPKGVEQACIMDPNGAVHFLGTLGGPASQARAINDRGDVAGWSRCVPSATSGGTHAFVWDRVHGMRDLGRVTGRGSRAAAISQTGEVFGAFEYRHVLGIRWRPCYWDPNDAFSASGVETPGRDYFDMNGNGWVVGKHIFDKDGSHVVLWHPWHGIQKLFPYDPNIDVSRQSTWLVNDVNQVVYTEEHRSRWERYSARFFGPQHDCYLWDPDRGRISLNRYLPSGAGRFDVCDVNNKGSILGIAHLKRGQLRLPVLLEPIRERWEQ
jgi:probable HAF family extracellular repeat protein